MAQKIPSHRNSYRLAVELNQMGKYAVRIRARFGRHDWELALFFLAASFDRAVQRLEAALQQLQKNEEALWFWSVDRSDDPHFAGELIAGLGVALDRRGEFPRKAFDLTVIPERPVPAFLFARARRALAESLSSPRAAAASD